MNKSDHYKIIDIFRKHIAEAVSEISETGLTSFFWGENTDEILAEQAAGVIMALQDTEDERSANEPD